MNTTTCPHCGKPVRPGARFCGSCGNAITKIPQPAAVQPEAIPPAQPSAVNCPHCSKPVRPGAKFCNNCGQEIPSEVIPEPAVSAAAPQPPPAPPVEAAAPPAAPVKPVVETPVPSPKRKRRALVPIVLIGLIFGCALLLAGGYYLLKYVSDPTGLIVSRTPTSEVGITETITAETAEATATQTTTTEATLTPEVTLTSTVALSPTNTITPTVTGEPVLLLDEKFDTELTDNWSMGGNPLPIHRTGGFDKYVELRGVDIFGTGYLTAKVEIRNKPGIEILFQAQLTPQYRLGLLILDWDISERPRGPESEVEGELHLEISRNELGLYARLSDQEPCRVQVNGIEIHSYRIRFLAGQGVALFIDNAIEPVCEIVDMGLAEQNGRITFTGAGLVNMVQVSAPAE